MRNEGERSGRQQQQQQQQQAAAHRGGEDDHPTRIYAFLDHIFSLTPASLPPPASAAGASWSTTAAAAAAAGTSSPSLNRKQDRHPTLPPPPLDASLSPLPFRSARDLLTLPLIDPQTSSLSVPSRRRIISRRCQYPAEESREIWDERRSHPSTTTTTTSSSASLTTSIQQQEDEHHHHHKTLSSSLLQSTCVPRAARYLAAVAPVGNTSWRRC